MSIEKKVIKRGENNPEVVICGWLKDSFKENHRLDDGAVIFENYVKAIDFWGNIKNEIPLQIDGRCLKIFNHHFVKDEFVELHGQLRTKNVYDGDGKKIQRRCYVFVKSIEVADEGSITPQNRVSIYGLLARKGKIHQCKNGNVMFDFTVDIRRSHGRRSSIPCVIWGRERVYYLERTPKNAMIELDGWIKTRIITDSSGITKSVAEIIVDNFQIQTNE